MKEKILDIIYTKLSEGYKTKFIPFNDFEEQLAEKKDYLIGLLSSYMQEYSRLLNSENTDDSNGIIKVSKEDYILQKYNSSHYGIKFNKENLDDFKNGTINQNDIETYKSLEEEYKGALYSTNRQFVIPLADYVMKTIEEKLPKISWVDFNTDTNLENLFWRFIYELAEDVNHDNTFLYYYYIERIQENKDNFFDKIVEDFRSKYLINEYLFLHHYADKYLSDIEFTGLETIIVNVGSRTFKKEHSGWITNMFNILNNDESYSYISTAKDVKLIKGHFINIFILQNKFLEKISIAIQEQEQTKFIISKDFEKLSIKNECEVHISKHHGNETIIFDSKKEALKFQSKILELKEWKGQNK